jgi:type II secretory pathway component PulJ
MRRVLRRRDELGMSVIEITIAITLMIAVTPIVASVMTNTLEVGVATEDQSRTVDELRGQMYSVSRELRSATCIRVPTTPNTAGDTLFFTTESQVGNATTTRHLHYRIETVEDGLALVRREYNGTDLTTASVIGTNIVGPGLQNPSTTFELKETPRRSVVINLSIRFGDERTTQKLSTTVAGRNAWLTC